MLLLAQRPHRSCGRGKTIIAIISTIIQSLRSFRRPILSNRWRFPVRSLPMRRCWAVVAFPRRCVSSLGGGAVSVELLLWGLLGAPRGSSGQSWASLGPRAPWEGRHAFGSFALADRSQPGVFAVASSQTPASASKRARSLGVRRTIRREILDASRIPTSPSRNASRIPASPYPGGGGGEGR